MTEKHTYRLVHAQARQRAAEHCKTAPDGWVVTVQPPTRSLESNARMWAMLGEIAAQVEWHGKKLGTADWKAIFTASLKGMNVVPNLENTGFVALGQSTSRMSVKDMADLQELMAAFAEERGVKFKAMESDYEF